VRLSDADENVLGAARAEAEKRSKKRSRAKTEPPAAATPSRPPRPPKPSLDVWREAIDEVTRERPRRKQ
jgi:hypothetical protein